jgi:hypothetical protein
MILLNYLLPIFNFILEVILPLFIGSISQLFLKFLLLSQHVDSIFFSLNLLL